MAILVPIRDRLCYPAGYTPGFDPSHPASQGCYPNNGFSGVPMFNSGQYRNLLNGKKANTITGVPTRNIWGVVGPTVVFNSTTMALSFTGQSTATPTQTTLAGIFYATNVVTGNTQIIIGAGNSNFSTFNNNMFVSVNGTNVNTNITVLVNTPYFFACSLQPTVQNSVLLNLRTGLMVTSVTTTALTFAAAGNVIVGNANLTSQGATGGVAACMWSNTFLSIQQLMAWAADPWAFWYPDINWMDDLIVGQAAVGPPGPGPNFQSATLPMMGV